MKKIIEIIKINFPNGIRDDFIDTNKVLRIYAANYPNENISRAVIVAAIHKNAVADGGRFYFISEKVAEDIARLMEEILEKFSIAYYAKIYEEHADFFSRRHIFSPEVLKKFLQEIDADCFCYDEFCSAKRWARLDNEIEKIFSATEESLSLEDLQKNFPYVPKEKISAVLSDMKKYLPTIAGRFISVSKIRFDFEELETAKQQIISAAAASGCAAPEDYNLSSNFALNPEIAEKNLRDVIYEKFFSADFDKRGKKFFKKGFDAKKEFAATDRLREFIFAQDELSAEKLFDFAENAGIAPHNALQTAYEKMIRVEKNLFVKDAPINFDVDGVDEALTPFVQGKIISLRAVTSFTGFPSVAGYSWNFFLLESFLRKYSRQYVYAAPAANSANIGAIYPASRKFENYLDIQASAVVQENIPLEKVAVENFLIGQGFRVKRIDKVTARIISRAQEILYR